ncbi:DUF4145 domain-containing protein [Sebaldella termitidis]|uniref:DUF4145 domain-containing protein n=1 Tax=Sebaldella termitidis TaxID=826 RepID=UPI003EBC37D4
MKEKIYCNCCKQETNHTQVRNFEHTEVSKIDDDEEMEVAWQIYWYMWQCMGCNDIVIENVVYFNGFDLEGSGKRTMSFFYPERRKKMLLRKEYIKIPDQIRNIYDEIIEAFNNSCYLLCSIGLRTLLEAVCVDKGIVSGNLMNKIDNSTFITDNIKKNLHGIRYLGNDATHDFISPKKEDLELTIKILEDILNTVYDLDYKSTIMYNKFKKTT